MGEDRPRTTRRRWLRKAWTYADLDANYQQLTPTIYRASRSDINVPPNYPHCTYRPSATWLPCLWPRQRGMLFFYYTGLLFSPFPANRLCDATSLPYHGSFSPVPNSSHRRLVRLRIFISTNACFVSAISPIILVDRLQAFHCCLFTDSYAFMADHFHVVDTCTHTASYLLPPS